MKRAKKSNLKKNYVLAFIFLLALAIIISIGTIAVRATGEVIYNAAEQNDKRHALRALKRVFAFYQRGKRTAQKAHCMYYKCGEAPAIHRRQLPIHGEHDGNYNCGRACDGVIQN